MNAIRISSPGGIDALEYVETPNPEPDAGKALIRLHAIGVNFLDVYHRNGLYPLRTPFTPGSEGAGVVEKVGEGVTEFSVGDRVVYSHIGSYSDLSVVPVDRLVALPDDIDFRSAAASFVQGLTAHYLVNSTYDLKAAETILVHAAAGGVGGLLSQLAKARGARVIGTASTRKLSVAREAGADLVIDYTLEKFDERVLAETGGQGVDVVYDSVGRTTFDGSLACLRVRGMLVSFGQSSGPVAPVDVLRLGKKSLYLTRPTLAHYTSDPKELRWRADELFASIRSGGLQLRVDRELPLRDAAEAHRLLESRAAMGKLVLIP